MLATLLDEASRRKDGCDFTDEGSAAVVLADGQAWRLPKPWLQVHASFQGAQAVETAPRLTYGPEIDALLTAIAASDETTALLCAAATLGAYLVRVNYDLADRDLDELFAFRIGDPASWDWARAVMDVATGRSGPKRGRGGAS